MRAVAILKNGRVFIQRYALTTAGVYIAHGAVRCAAANDPEAIGHDLRLVFSASEVTLAHPSQSEWANVQRPMFEAAGAKSWAALAKGSRSVGIECDGSDVVFTPSANYEDIGGISLPDRVASAKLLSAELGEKLLAALGACD